MTAHRPWTEDETLLAYWALPLMRAVGRVTNRPFPAIAMKLANLLAVETNFREGLPNVSAMDRAVVGRFALHADELEERVAQLLSGQALKDDRTLAEEVREEAVDLVQRHGIPLHLDVLSALLIARNLGRIIPKRVIAAALRTSDQVVEVEPFVFTRREPD